MSLNYSLLPLYMGENVRTVGVRFFVDRSGATHGKIYTYLTTHNFEQGDLAVVMVRGCPKVVEVQYMDAPTQDNEEYKWIVCPVDTSAYLRNLETCQDLAKKVRQLEHDSKKRQLFEALGLGDQVKKLTFS